jgi:membrane fusion protein (multidrug efflux system)
MRKLTYIVFLSFLALAACSDDLEKLQKEKKSIQSDIKKLEAELIEINEAIAKLDTTTIEENAELVTVLEIKESNFANYIEAQGKTYTEDNILVTTDMGGLVRAVYVDEGQFVNKGTSLFQLDNSIIANQLAELETSIALAYDVYDKRKRLWDQNIGSEIEYLQAKNTYESLLNKKATIQTQMGKSTIKAPISGYVDVINLKLGEMAAPGMPACQLVNNKNMEVRVDLPETYIGKAKKGDKILVEIPALGIEKTATIKSISQLVNQFNRAFQVIAVIDENIADIKPNMLTKVKFTNETVSKALVIPTGILQEGGNNEYFIYVAKMDTASKVLKAHKQVITIGESSDGQIVVTEGLKSGDLVINKGFRNVLEGQNIEVKL